MSTKMTYTKQQIVDKAREVADMIAETEEVDFFKRAEAQINENQQIREKIASLKSLQKQAVNFQHYGKERALELIEKKSRKSKMKSMLCRLCRNSSNHKAMSIRYCKWFLRRSPTK